MEDHRQDIEDQVCLLGNVVEGAIDIVKEWEECSNEPTQFLMDMAAIFKGYKDSPSEIANTFNRLLEETIPHRKFRLIADLTISSERS